MHPSIQPDRTVLWWVRRDLRLHDNHALTESLRAGGRVIPVFILDPALINSRYTGEKRLSFLFGGLRELDADLRSRGSRLIVRQGDPGMQLAKLVHETDAAIVFAEQDHSPYAAARDSRVATDVNLRLVASTAIRPPGTVLKSDGTPYTVFTPFSRAWLSMTPVTESDLIPAPRHLPDPGEIGGATLPTGRYTSAQNLFPPGEAEALRRLQAFVQLGITEYGDVRNRLDLDGTSRISPYLRFGMISPLRTAAAAPGPRRPGPTRPGPGAWLNELIWRDFYIHILHHFPHVRVKSFKENLRDITWRNVPAEFDAWRYGQTGYPVVDAAMRQLAESGWMHNRARMIVASFLVKDLLIDWRWGEQWFMQNLLDGDPAANNGGWQWTAGTGTDAAPYFRIFNPVTQGKKFDPNGDFVRRWLPELQAVPTEYIHEPWQMARARQQEAGCLIGRDYPLPMVDHGIARERTLEAFAAGSRVTA